MRLNKYIAHSGVCSRRKAAELVKNAQIMVNGTTEVNPSYMVQEGDKVVYEGKELQREINKIYLLLNKPKGYITTVDDERGRKTVMELVEKKVQERIFPVGRLDKDTTGLLLFSNDGDLAKKLTHPSHKSKKIYHVILDKEVPKETIEEMRKGANLEDGFAVIDKVDYVIGKPKNQIGIEIHIGKNRVVRRICQHFGFRVIKLDRVYFCGLTKKDLPRGFARHLSEKEVIMLKHFTS